MQKPSGIGGQAVMEGIMMRRKKEYAIAVRKPDGEIALKKEEYRPVIKIADLEKIPILRGIGAFLDSLIIGTGCIMYSASFFEEEEEKPAGEDEKPLSAEEARKRKERSDRLFTIGTVTTSILFTVCLFILLPYFLAGILRRAGVSEVLVSVTEALLRVVIFLLYMILISRLKDIQRVFMYHGAEHKCINCVEHGMPLTVENVLKSSREHKRCGTSFLLIVVLLSVVCFFIIGLLGITRPLLRFGIRILLIPVIAGLSYEFIRFAGSSDSALASALSKPGLLMQRLVTREPDADQAAVAIAAVEAVFDWREYLRENFPETEIPEA